MAMELRRGKLSEVAYLRGVGAKFAPLPEQWRCGVCPETAKVSS
jgi:hypothetical protein